MSSDDVEGGRHTLTLCLWVPYTMSCAYHHACVLPGDVQKLTNGDSQQQAVLRYSQR